MPVDDPKKLRALLDLSLVADELVEEALQKRESLSQAMQRVLPVLCQRVGARAAFVRSFSEDLKLTSFAWPPDFSLAPYEEVVARTSERSREDVVIPIGDDLVVAQALDVAGEWFGSAGLVVPRSSPLASDPPHLAALLEVACEELDNFLHAIRAARERHRVMMQLGDVLRERVLGDGLRAAVRLLADTIAIDRLLLVYVAEEDQAETLHVQVFEKGEPLVDTLGSRTPHPHERAILSEARAYLLSGDTAIVDRFGFRDAREEVLINGVTRASVVGKVLVTSVNAGFNTYDRELLAGFSGFVRQRVVDFNKEWRTLARSFRPDDVARLLHDPEYAKRYLAPREAEVAILYVDISGFTSISERVLKNPAAVAELVELWSRESVNIIWKHGGVFDKMVGDCVIALFGPPFYDSAPKERLAAAIRGALAIRTMTSELPSRAGFEHLREAGLGVSTGVNLAPLFVGQFGPNDNFTGFSSGMNNTARLQGCAAKDEILVMADAALVLTPDQGISLGPERNAKVKNVADPLRFRDVL
ncbi:MAG TPA: adenylate/guanylate cyclase domain-containing protein [Polyangiaceae bacterium]|nr:adenylate/guanylate cyclase domain-containing protein [Polyangiaceae bacterium]